MNIENIDAEKFYMEDAVTTWNKIRSLRFQESTNPSSLNPDGIFAKALREREE